MYKLELFLVCTRLVRMCTWLEWFEKHNNRVSFIDDNHAGGTIKHILLLPNSINQTRTLVCLGYYGTDELQTLAALDCNSLLSAETFIRKYNKPFHAIISMPIDTMQRPVTATLLCNFTFTKDTHGDAQTKPSIILTAWHHESSTDKVVITFNDFVKRNTTTAYNTWTSTLDVPYERDATLGLIIDRCLLWK